MRITLEKADLVSLLGKALGVELDITRVTVHPDPFEVIIADAGGIVIPPGDLPNDTPPKHVIRNLDEDAATGGKATPLGFDDISSLSAALERAGVPK